MVLITRAGLLALWKRGFKPQQSNYADMFYSFWHKEDVLPSDIVPINTIADLPPQGSDQKLYVVLDTDGGGTTELRVWKSNAYINPISGGGSGGYNTAIQVRDALQTLVDNTRLSATAIQGLPQVPQTRPASEITVADQGGNFSNTLLEDVLIELYNQDSTSSEGGRIVLDRPGITVDIEYDGVTAPTLSGDNTAGYVLTIPNGTRWRVLDVEALQGGSATNNNTFTLTITNNNAGGNVPPTGFKDRAITEIKDLGTGEILSSPRQQRGITRSETVSNGSVTNTFTSIGALTGFAILFTR